MKLGLKLSVSVCIGSLEFGNLILKKGDLRSVVLFESFDLNKLLSDLLFFSVLKFPFHVVGSSGHEIFEFVFFLFKLDFRNLLFVEDVIAFKTERFALLDFILQH